MEISGKISTAEAVGGIVKLNIIIMRNTLRAINKFVHRFPWACIFVITLVAIIMSSVNIGKARAERDSYNKKNAQLMQKIDSYEAILKK